MAGWRSPARRRPLEKRSAARRQCKLCSLLNSEIGHRNSPRLARTCVAGFVLANGPAMAGSSNQTGEGEIRKAMVEAGVVNKLNMLLAA